MGCTQSKIENEEAVTRCKDRKMFMKEAVSARNAFAAAHSAYTMSLKNTGAALSDYAHGEVQNPQDIALNHPHVSPALPLPPTAAPPPPLDPLVPPPPPPDPFQPIQRAASMPAMNIAADRKEKDKGVESNGVAATIIEEEEEEEEEDVAESSQEKLITRKRSSVRNRSAGAGGDHHSGRAMQAPPQQDSAWDYFFPSMEHMPGPTLEVKDEKEEVIDRKVFDQIPKSVEEEQPVTAEVEMEMEPPRMDEEKRNVVEEEVGGAAAPPPPPESSMGSVGRSSFKKAKGGGGSGGMVEKKGGKFVSLLQVFVELDDHFLKASESAHEVSKMLEATRLHYHSNFADNRGHIDHSARVMRVITWNRSFKGMPNVEDLKDDFDSEENETHATVLDKLLAWEKKLYDEVKAGEHMKFEYQRKVAQLNRQKKRGSNPEGLEKIKANVSHLHTRYIVDMQSMDSTVLEINRLRDQQLYPKLVQLVDAMSTMWESMYSHHERQYEISQALKAVDTSQSPKETTEHHHDRTMQLWAVVQEWNSQFGKLVDHQREYVKALNNWLRLNLIPIESSLKEKVSSPPRVVQPPIQKLLLAWLDNMDKLQDGIARSAIGNFAAIVNTIMHLQEEEVKQKERCENTRKELTRKTRAFEDWYHKYTQRRTPDEFEAEDIHKDAVTERKHAVEMLKINLQEEEEAYQRLCVQVREKSLISLKTHLPELFKAMYTAARSFSLMYKDLRYKSHHLNRNERPS